MDISDITLNKEELEILGRFVESDVYMVLKKMAISRMEELKEEAIISIGNDPHGNGLRQGEYQVLSNLIILPSEATNKLEEIKNKPIDNKS